MIQRAAVFILLLTASPVGWGKVRTPAFQGCPMLGFAGSPQPTTLRPYTPSLIRSSSYTSSLVATDRMVSSRLASLTW